MTDLAFDLMQSFEVRFLSLKYEDLKTQEDVDIIKEFLKRLMEIRFDLAGMKVTEPIRTRMQANLQSTLTISSRLRQLRHYIRARIQKDSVSRKESKIKHISDDNE